MSCADHIGVKIDRLQPGTISGAFHYHLYEDEFCLILKGRAMLQYGEKTIEVREGDAISFPQGEQIAHQFYNHTERTVDILMMGENIKYDVCYYPDSDQWQVSSSRLMGRKTAVLVNVMLSIAIGAVHLIQHCLSLLLNGCTECFEVNAMTGSRLQDAMGDVMGMPPHTYLNQIWVDRAKQLLKQGMRSQKRQLLLAWQTRAT